MKKRLKYQMLFRFPGGEWTTGTIHTSYDKAREYAMNASNGGLDCAMVVSRGGQFEYEQRFYGLDEQQRFIQGLRKGK